MYDNKPLLITIEQVKELTPFSKNIDDDKIKSSLFYCQDTFISKALGRPLYKQLLDQTAGGTISPTNLILLNGNDRDLSGIRVTLAAYTAWHALMYVTYAITQKGLVKRFDPNSDTATADDINIMRSNLLNNAESYQENLIGYLEDDRRSDSPVYPLYGEGRSDGTAKKASSGASGIAGI